ncbi:Na+/H+ antiporter subunit E [Sphingomonas sp. IC-56]|uniref:Na+/H+ antiporter subunit E n=1 Tax=Sphingomonas sp. IC-56 TaxID=2898529 RepID=UPI001E29E89C|nr:Na+/H+ antiporter subunit E [Sphingomonas sp. IC-56]MCD2324151.1 Na+/H+ antiporter subunit E [Sphingomonas sp. IC-56]
MTRWIPYPAVTAGLLLLWLLLTQSFSAGQVLLGAAVAVFAGRAMALLRPPPPGRIRIAPMLRLAGLVMIDVVRSNLAVAAIVLFRRRDRVADFVRIPLDLADRNGLALLALIISATPGTLWVDYDRRKRLLLLHVLDLIDEAQWVALIKDRYEALLIEAFER